MKSLPPSDPWPARVHCAVTGFEVLTWREWDVVEAIAVRGLSLKLAARALGITHRTVESHRSHIFEKLCVKNIVELTRKVYPEFPHP